ncbi:unnamed protein product [Blepharisma stoltei]|uniref:RNA polymerase II-associated protein 3 n=1 Tax=Blepharisma stoltei TaxID=1481888 RepID=A0AAU9J7T3_9CILI|nr:unnamed protein product [Blepharisma stoltei]
MVESKDVTIADINLKQSEEEKEKGNEFLRSGDYENAIDCYNIAEYYQPTNPAIFCNRALAYLKSKKYENAIEDCDKAIHFKSNYAKAYVRRGKAYLALKEYSKASKDFGSALKIEPNNSEIQNDLQICMEELSKIKIKKDEKPSELTETKIEDVLNYEIKIEEFDDDAFINQILQICHEQEKKAENLFSEGKYEEAKHLYEDTLHDLINLTPKDIYSLSKEKCKFYTSIASCYCKLGDYKKEIECLNLVINSKYAYENLKLEAYLNRGLSLERLNNFIDSFEDFKKASELSPDDPKIQEALQRVLNVTKEIVENENMKELLDKESLINQIEKMKEGGNQLFKKGQLEGAIIEFSGAIEILEKNTSQEIIIEDKRLSTLLVNLLNNRALVYTKLDSWNKVMHDTQRVLDIDPLNAKAYYRLGKAEGNTGDYGNAAKHMKKVMEFEPSNLVAKNDFENYLNLAIESKKKSQAAKEDIKIDDAKPKVEVKTKNSKNEIEETKAIHKQSNNFSQSQKKFVDDALEMAEKESSRRNNPRRISSSEFEGSINSFRSDCFQIYNYIHNFPIEEISLIYKNKPMNPDVLSKIIKAIYQNAKNDSEWLTQFIIELSNTSGFIKNMKFMSGQEKKCLKEIISEMSADESTKLRIINSII